MASTTGANRRRETQVGGGKVELRIPTITRAFIKSHKTQVPGQER
jgi:hypothetical protein